MEAFDMPDYTEVGAQIAQLQLGMDAAELHGSLCGFLSGGESPGRKEWLPRVMAEPEPGVIERDSALDRLFVATEALLESPDFGFELLLPDESSPIGERGDALLGWCRGFLGGFGLSAGEHPPLSEDGADALRDLARMAASELSYEDPEGDEESLAEITEFVRVAALLLHGDCVLGPRHRKSLN
jgi:yecA family protein